MNQTRNFEETLDLRKRRRRVRYLCVTSNFFLKKESKVITNKNESIYASHVSDLAIGVKANKHH